MEDLAEIYWKPLHDIAGRKTRHIIASLERRGMKGVFFQETSGAVDYIVSEIPRNAVVALGGSMSVTQSGLLDALRGMTIELLDRYRPGLTAEEVHEMRLRAMHADVLVASCNAVTADGRLVNEDGVGNRVGGMIFGPAKVILLVGVNKIVGSLDEAISRIRNVAAPPNCVRLGHRTPCAETGFCDDEHCVPPERICCQLTVIEANRFPGRITVVFAGEALGF
jgi:hypothetical protein